MSAANTEQDLIRKAASGDKLALGELLLSHSPRLTAYLTPKLPASVQPTIDIDDVLQQTFTHAFRHIDQLKRPTPHSFAAWLTKIGENQLSNAITRLHRKKRGGQHRQRHWPVKQHDNSMGDLVDMLEDHGRTGSQLIARREAVCALQIAIADLPQDQQQAVRLHLLEGQSLADTAAAMRRTPGAINGLVQRAKQQLREAMGRASAWLSRK
jgi:RNA polymerase sigma-70 factor (ECF subfamily)